MAAELEIQKPSIRDWISINTEFDAIALRLLDAPSSGISAWARTTAGIVAFLIFLQFFTGILLAFQYVPTVDNAYTTVAYIEQVIKCRNLGSLASLSFVGFAADCLARPFGADDL